MSARVGLLPCLAIGVWLAAPAPVGAHRLDQYLQATRLSIDVDRVGLEIDLTAGVAVASDVFASMDTNRDGEVSTAEGEAYAREMLRFVVLSVDGRPAPIALDAIRIPPLGDMSAGVGTIRVRANAQLAYMGAGDHRLAYVNTHRPESSVYLVNALVPDNPRIRIAGQRRDRAQHGLTLDYTVADPPWARSGSLLLGVVMAGVLIFARRPRTRE